MPSGVVDLCARRGRHLRGAVVVLCEPIEDGAQAALVAKDAGVSLHRGLQLSMESIWILASGPRQEASHLVGGLRQLDCGGLRPHAGGGDGCRRLARALSEHETGGPRAAPGRVGA